MKNNINKKTLPITPKLQTVCVTPIENMENKIAKHVDEVTEITGINPDVLETLKRNFKIIDLNDDGLISKDEIKAFCDLLGEEVTDEKIDELITLSDPNGDGNIDFEEFCQGATAI